jgi:hypothetical protein
MALRLETDFYSQEGTKYTVSIYDSGWGGSDSTFNATSLELLYTDPGRRFPAFLASELTIGILVENSTIDDFVEDLMNAADGVFELVLKKDDALDWVGIIKTDAVTQQDRPYPYNFVLSATDGIGRLKDIDYNNNGTKYTGKATFLDHVYNIIGKLNLDGYWGASEDYVVTLNDWREENLTYAVGTDPWEQVGTIHHHLYEVVDLDNNELKFQSCYEVLMHIVTQFGMRLMLSGGAYRFMQPNYQAETGTVVIRKFDKSKNITTTSSTSLALWDAEVGEPAEFKAGTVDLFKVTSGGFQAYPPLNYVRVAYAHNSISNWIAGYDITTLSTIEDINSNSGSASLAFQGTIKIDSFSGTDTFIYVELELRLTVGSYYLKRTQTINYATGDLNTSDFEWTLTSTDRVSIIVVVPNTNVLFDNIGFVTPPIPADGDLAIQLDYVETTNVDGDVIPDATLMLSWYFENGYVEILGTNDLSEQYNTTYYQEDNDTTGNIANIDLTTIWGGDSHPTTSGRMSYTTNGGVTWTVSDQWRNGGSGTYIDIQQLLAQEVLFGQKTPVKKMVSQTYRGHYSAHFTLVRNSENWLFAGGTHDMYREEWSGSWFFLSKDTTGTSPVLVPINIKEIQVGTPAIYFSAPSTQTPGLAILEIIKDIDVTPDGADGNAPITSIQTGMTKETGYEEIFIPVMHPGGLFLDGDSVVVKSKTTGHEQAFITSKTGHSSGGDSVLTEYLQEANYDFAVGDLVIPSPLEQQYNISFGRRKFLQFHLVDYDTDFTTSTSYVDLPKFFKPYGSQSTSSDTNWIDRLAIRNVYFIVGQNVSGSASIQYTVAMVRGSTPSTVVTTTVTGATQQYELTPTDSSLYFKDEVYRFRYKKNDASGLSENKGLYAIIEVFNKKWYPGDFGLKMYWYRLEDDYTAVSGFLDVWSSGSTAMNFSAFSSTQRPEIIYNSLNGHPGAKFERSSGSDYLETSSAGPDTSTVDFTLSILLDTGDLDAVKGHGIFCQADAAGTGRELLWINTSLEIQSTFGGVNLTGPVLSSNTVYLITLSWDGTNQRLYVNGAFDSTNTPTPEGVPGNYYIGRSKAGSNTPYFDGIIYEIIFYEEWLPDTQREMVEGYLSNKYTIPLDG